MVKETTVKPKRKPTGAAAMGAGPGRPKGSENKNTAALKDMILQALHNSGGVKYLEKQAAAKPVAFLTLIGKVLPMQVTGPDGGALQAKITVEYVAPRTEKP